MSDLVSSPLWQYRYQLTRADIAAFEGLRVDGVRPVLIAVVLVGVLTGWHYERFARHLPAEADGVIGQAMLGLVIAGVGFAVARAIGWLRRRWRIARHRLPTGEMIVDVFGDHIAWNCDGRAETRAWERVGDIIGTPEHVFVFVAPGQPLIMPLRAFDGPTDMAAFADWANTNIETMLEILSAKGRAPD